MKQGGRWAPFPGQVNRGLVFPYTSTLPYCASSVSPKVGILLQKIEMRRKMFWITVDSFVPDPQTWWELLQGCFFIQNTYSKSLINNSEHISQLHIIFSTISWWNIFWHLWIILLPLKSNVFVNKCWPVSGLQETGENKNEYSKKNRFEITSCEPYFLKWLALK